MGFPEGYCEFFLHVVFILSHIRRLAWWAFNCLVDSDSPWLPGEPPTNHHHHHHRRHHQLYPQFHSISAMLIRDLLPVVRFHDMQAEGGGQTAAAGESCVVCLIELEDEAEVRRLSNCRHVFHKCCLDRWVEHHHATCPLCRSPLVPDELQDALNDRVWAAAGIPDSFYFASF